MVKKTLKGSSWLYRLVIACVGVVFALFYRHRIYGLQHFCRGPAILVANHTSFYDPPILAISAPQEVHFLAREGLFSNPLFGGFIRRTNAHPVSKEAGSVAVLKTACQLLAGGKKIIIFPEGTRSSKDELLPLKSGVALLLSRSQTAVIPAYIAGAFSIWNRKRKFPKLFGRTACVFGTPIRWSAYAHLGKSEGQEAFMKDLQEVMQRLRLWYEAGAVGSPP